MNPIAAASRTSFLAQLPDDLLGHVGGFVSDQMCLPFLCTTKKFYKNEKVVAGTLKARNEYINKILYKNFESEKLGIFKTKKVLDSITAIALYEHSFTEHSHETVQKIVLQFSRLQILDLRLTGITDQDLQVFATIKTLRVIIYHHDPFSFSDGKPLSKITEKGFEALAFHPALEELYLECDLNLKSLQSINTITRLKTLSITSNTLSNKDMQALQHPKLRNLNIHCKKLTDNALQCVVRNQKLVQLDISACSNITTDGMKFLIPHQNLQDLKVSLNTQNAESVRCALESIAHIPKLQSLHIYSKNKRNNEPDPIDIEPLTVCQNLQELVLVDNPISSFSSLKKMKKLQRLDLYTLQNVSAKDIEQLVALPLQSLYIRRALKASDEALRKLSQIKTLTLLAINRSVHLSDMTVKALVKGLDKLQNLYLNHCPRISDESMDFLSQTNIQVLSIIGTKVTEKGLIRLASLQSLKKLHIESFKVAADEVSSFKKMRPDVALITIKM